MKRPQLMLNCSCGRRLRYTASPVYRRSEAVDTFLLAHNGPDHIVTDRDGVVMPPPAVVEVRRAGGPELPGFEEVATKPSDRYPS